jgi:hypothetical protein
MIRIDEIYNNIFLQLIQQKEYQCIHYFDPFGSTSFKDLCTVPKFTDVGKHFLFWDQEPLHLDVHQSTLEQYREEFSDDPTVLISSEYNSDDINLICNRYNFEQCYYFFHGWASLDWYRGYNKSFLHQPKNIKHTFLCPNNIVGGKRQHRLTLLNELAKRDLVNTNIISFPATCPYEGIKVQDQLDYDVELPLTFDNFDNYANNSHQITMWKQAAESLVHVVTETSYSGKKNHLTEKTFKPIVLKQPFILVSNQGSLEYLRRYGFKTFEGIWDESYDTLPDNQRISAIGNLLQELEHSNSREWLSEQCAPIVQHNYDWFYSGKFEQVLWDELLNMVSSW